MQGLVLKQFSTKSAFSFVSPAATDSPPTLSMHFLSLPCKHRDTPLLQNKNVKFRILCQQGELDHGMDSEGSHEDQRITVEPQPQGTLAELEDYGFGREENKLRWRFISKVYGVLVAQVAFCASVSTAVTTLKTFFCGIHPVIAFSAGIIPFLLMWPMIIYRKRKPLNFFMLAIFTCCTSIVLGLQCALLISEKLVIQELLTAAVAVLPITGYAIWGSVSGQDFRYPVPFSFSCTAILTMTIIQLFYPLVSAAGTLLAGLVGIIFAGFLVYERNELIKRHAEKEFIGAAICIYMDIIHVFLCTFHVLRLVVEYHCWFFGLTE